MYYISCRQEGMIEGAMASSFLYSSLAIALAETGTPLRDKWQGGRRRGLGGEASEGRDSGGAWTQPK